MECNKEEAIRCKQIAEQKMQKSDFAGALKFAEKGQRLYPELESVSQLLAVCEVHCSAEIKLSGSQMDWYRILQIEQLAGEADIKKQYRKLALLLHPDKNKFTGSEAAFKLIGEANRVLVDPAARSLYDMKCRASVKAPAQKPSSHHFNENSSVPEAANTFQNIPSSQFSGSHYHQQTFWTRCFFCNMRFQYQKNVLQSLLSCQNCQRFFVACDMGAQGIPPGSSRSQHQNHKLVPNRGPAKVASQNGRGAKTKKKDGDMGVKVEKEDVGKPKSDAPVKLTKMKASYKLSEAGKKVKPAAKTSTEKMKSKPKQAKAPAAPKAKVAKMVVAKKSTPAKPKSIKSPAAKKAKKAM